MKVFVIGGTGFLGTYLLPKLMKHGHNITILTRREEEVTRLETFGIQVVIGDLLQPELFINQLPLQDVVIHIAMPKIKFGRISRKQFRILKSQVNTFVSSSIAISQKLKCPLILTMGASFRTSGFEVADENSRIERFGIARLGELVDPLLIEVINRGTPPLIRVLPGQIYGPGGLFKTMYEWMKKGKYRVVGSGNNYIPRIHVEDCAEAYIRIVEKMPIGESFIIADDEPCTVREFVDFMANCMDVQKPKSVPRLLARIFLGKTMYETVTMNCRVSNAKAKNQLNWRPKFSTYLDGLPPTVKELSMTSN